MFAFLSELDVSSAYLMCKVLIFRSKEPQYTWEASLAAYEIKPLVSKLDVYIPSHLMGRVYLFAP